MKFHDASSVPNDPDIINFWRLLPCEQFPELKKEYAHGYICRFETNSDVKSILI